MNDKISRLKLLAPAKVNLNLYILGKRPDGYHEIFTVMQRVSLFDILHLERTKFGFDFSTNHFELKDPKTNLIYKATQLFFKTTNLKAGVKIHLIKKIPIGAGLGGGSSNAAITLLGLNYLFNKPLSQNELVSLGSQIGSDVAFFFYKAPAICTGRGEIITPLPFKIPFWYVIVSPPIKVSTAWVYEQVRLTRKNFQIKIKFLLDILQNLNNDLEAVVTERVKECKVAIELLKNAGAQYILLSGSGASVFAICKDRKEAVGIGSKLKLPSPKWQVFVVKGL